MHFARQHQNLMLVARTALFILGVATALPGYSAQPSWRPDQNVEIVVPSSPGAGTDITSRFMQRLLNEKKLVQSTVVIVNKPGGAGTLAVNYLNQYSGNGHYFMATVPTLLTSHIIGVSKLNYTDTTPLAQMGSESVVFAVRADSPFKTGKDLAARFKTDVGSVSVAFANALGNHNHIAAAQVVRAVGGNVKNLKVVVYNGSGDVVTALLGGHIDVVTSVASAVLPLSKAGKVRIIAVSAEQRLGGSLADVPTWREFGIASVSPLWRGAVGPKGMTEGQIQYWDTVFAKLVQLPEWKEAMEARLVENTYLNARDTKKMMDSEYVELKTVLTELGLAK